MVLKAAWVWLSTLLNKSAREDTVKYFWRLQLTQFTNSGCAFKGLRQTLLWRSIITCDAVLARLWRHEFGSNAMDKPSMSIWPNFIPLCHFGLLKVKCTCLYAVSVIIWELHFMVWCRRFLSLCDKSLIKTMQLKLLGSSIVRQRCATCIVTIMQNYHQLHCICTEKFLTQNLIWHFMFQKKDRCDYCEEYHTNTSPTEADIRK